MLNRLAAHCRAFLEELGEDPDRSGLKDTPMRWAKAMAYLTSGYKTDPRKILAVTFDEPYDQVVALRDIPFYSFCEHHILPFFGTVGIAYLPGDIDGVFGASKMARLVDCFSRRMQIQERLTQQIAKELEDGGVKGAAVVVRARHLCMEMRGVQKPGMSFETTDARGVMRDDPLLKAEWKQMLGVR